MIEKTWHSLRILFPLIFAAGFASAKDRVVTPQMSTGEIQAVIDASSSGDTVVFSAGKYSLVTHLEVNSKHNLTLRGKGGVTLVCNRSDSNVINVNYGSGVTLDSLHLTHLNPGDGTVCVGNVLFVGESAGTVVRNCNLDGCGAVGIYGFTRDVTVTGCHIHNCSIRPIEFVGRQLTLTGCVVETKDPGDVIFYTRSATPYAEPKTRVGVSQANAANLPGLTLKNNSFREDVRPGIRAFLDRVKAK